MKQTLTLFAALVLLAVGATAQKLSYSAVVRNSANELQANKTLTVGVSIANNATGNPAVYSETHSGVQTNQNGLLTLTIGEGTNVSGNLSNVTWSSAYITTTYTIDGSTVTNTVAVNAVPYALYAENSGTSTPVNDGVLTITMPDGTTKTFTANQLGNTNVTIPAAPTVNDGTLTIKQGENTLGTFSANQSGTTNVNIPAAPVVNNGTLTINMPDGTAKTFTANQSDPTEVTIPTYTLTAGDIINVINSMTAEEKAQMCAALEALGCSGTEPTPPTLDCPTLGATTIVPSNYLEPGVTPPTTYLEIETVINDYDENLVNPATAKFVITYTTESMTEPITTTVDNANASGAIMVDDGVMRYYFEEQQVVISMTVTPSIALAGACATPAMITGEPGTYPLACPSFVEQSTTVTPDPNAPTVMVVQAQIQNYAGEENISVENSGVKIKVNNSTIATIVAGYNTPENPIPHIEISDAGLMTAKIDCANYGTSFAVVPFLDSYCIDGIVDYTYTNHVDVEGTPVEVTMTAPVTPGFTVTDATVNATNGLTCNLKLIDPGMEPADLTDVTLKVGNTTFTPSVQQVPMKSISEMYELNVPYSDIVDANIDLSGNVLEDVEVDFKYGDQTYSAATNNAVETDFVICSTLGTTAVATTPATGDVVTFVATVDNSNTNITGKFFTITYMVGTTEQTLTLENSAVEINTDGNLVGHITETAATPLYGKTLTVVPTITLNAPCENSEGQSFVYNMPEQTSTSETFTCGENLTVGTNTYPTVLIGTQCWTKTNMREAAGTNATAGGDTSSTIPYHYVDPTSGEYLYNWAAAMQVCPDGWHLPADAEWTLMEKTLTTTEIDETYVGWRGNHAGKLAGGDAWNNSSTPNAPGNTNYSGWGTSGFAAIPAGYYWNNTFGRVSLDAHFWSATEEAGNWAWYRDLYYGNADVYRAYIRKPYGFSVRCLKDDTSGGGETSECPSLGNPTFCKEVGTNKVTITIKTPINHYDANLVGDIIYDVDFSIPMGGSIGSAHVSMATDGGVTNIDGNYVCLQEVELDAATWQSNQSLYMDYNRTIEYTSICGGTTTVTDNGSITVYEMPECVSGTCPSLGETGTPTAIGEMVTFITPINDYDANKIGLYSYRIYYTDDDFFVKYAGDGASVGAAGLAVSFNPAMELHGSYATSVCTLRIVPVLNVVCSDDALVGAGVEYVYVPAPEPFVCGTSTVKDNDPTPNTYATVLIGNQCWMAENLRSTRYADGTPINVGTATDATTPYRYAPGNNSVVTYGYLYNWVAVMHGANSSDANPSGVQGVCPAGWHVPSDAEWTQLTNYLSSQSTYKCGAGDNADNIAKALASKTTDWSSSDNTCAVGETPENNNKTGFDALPAGFYFSDGYTNSGVSTLFNSATEASTDNAWGRGLGYFYAYVNRGSNNKSNGYSVRCLKD